MPRKYTPGPLPFLPFLQIELTCVQCNVRFLVSRSRWQQRYCSQACFGASCRTAIARTCAQCGATFQAVPSAVASGSGRLCSRACADAALVVPVLERIRRHTDVRGPDDCWPWMAKRHARGYGETTIRRKDVRVTRVLLAARLGRPLAPDEHALHTCSNPPCCNPAHLFVGSHQENMDQRLAEGNYARGERHHAVSLTAEIVRAIRIRVAGGETRQAVARDYGISPSTAGRIVARRTWQHVT